MLNLIKSIFKDHFFDFYLWSQEVTIHTPLDDVKGLLPGYVKVDWNKPEQLGKGLLYPVTWIKGHRKKKRKYLGFVDGLYSGCVIKG